MTPVCLTSGLAKISYEVSRSSNGPKLPKPGKNKVVPREGAKWTIVPGHVALAQWTTCAVKLGLSGGPIGADSRSLTMCFVWSLMCVIDTFSEEVQLTPAWLSRPMSLCMITSPCPCLVHDRPRALTRVRGASGPPQGAPLAV